MDSKTANDNGRINAISCRLFDLPGRTEPPQFGPGGFGLSA